MSPLPTRVSAPFESRIVRESTNAATLKAMRVGRLALMRPVMTSVEGRWVARTRWMPAARAFWAMRATEVSMSFAATIMRSAISSMTQTTQGSFSLGISTSPGTAVAAASAAAARSSGVSSSSCWRAFSASAASLATRALKPARLRTLVAAKMR